MATTHISEAEAARDLHGLLARVRAGEEFLIESGSAPAAIIKSAPPTRGRLLSESIALADAHAQERGSDLVMDSSFAADMEQIIRDRKPADHTAWD